MIKLYTHKGITFQHLGGLSVCLPGKFLPLKLALNNGSPGWRLSSNILLSVKQLRCILQAKY